VEKNKRRLFKKSIDYWNGKIIISGKYMTRIIMHIDMDAFYASVEQKDNPEIKGKPVIVGADPKKGKGRGVVSAASYEAREYGIHSAMPISKAYYLCPQGIFLSVRGQRYEQISRKIIEIFHEYSPCVETISLDEAFLDITGSERLFGSPKKVGMEIKERIRNQEKLTASVGIGPNKLVSKIASDINKPDGLVIVQPCDVEFFLRDLPVQKIWGIGRETEKKLKGMGIRTVGQLASFSKDILEHVFGKMGVSLWNRANGIDDSPVISFRATKSISNEITFEKDELNREVLCETLLRLSEKVGYRLRKNRLMGKTVALKIRYTDFSTQIRHSTVERPLFNSEDIYSEIRRLFQNSVHSMNPVRLLGVGITQFVSRSEIQEDLFNDPEIKKRHASQAIDTLKDKYGEKIIGRGQYILKRRKRVV
jgi:DNA polymerase-4